MHIQANSKLAKKRMRGYCSNLPKSKTNKIKVLSKKIKKRQFDLNFVFVFFSEKLGMTEMFYPKSVPTGEIFKREHPYLTKTLKPDLSILKSCLFQILSRHGAYFV